MKFPVYTIDADIIGHAANATEAMIVYLKAQGDLERARADSLGVGFIDPADYGIGEIELVEQAPWPFAPLPRKGWIAHL